MPNYVYSQVHVLGYVEDVKRFEIEAKDENPSLAVNFVEQLLPLPQEATKIITTAQGTEFSAFTSLLQDGFDGYKAAVDLWGSKWVTIVKKEVSPISIGSRDLLHIEYTCESAWSPAIPAIEKISKMFPKLLFGISYIEEQPAFAGAICYNNGLVINDIDTLDMVPEPEIQNDDGNAWGKYWDELSAFTISAVIDLVFDITAIQSCLPSPLDIPFEPHKPQTPQSIFEY